MVGNEEDQVPGQHKNKGQRSSNTKNGISWNDIHIAISEFSLELPSPSGQSVLPGRPGGVEGHQINLFFHIYIMLSFGISLILKLDDKEYHIISLGS